MKYGNIDITQHIINQGIDIYAQDDYVLQWSAKNGHLEVVQ
jgi:hypothetical protein